MKPLNYISLSLRGTSGERDGERDTSSPLALSSTSWKRGRRTSARFRGAMLKIFSGNSHPDPHWENREYRRSSRRTALNSPLPYSQLFCLLLWIATVATLPAADPFEEMVRSTDPLTPDEQQKKFHLPPGFEIRLVAARSEERRG